MKFFITGVSSGIGRELAKELVKAGHEVWGLARRRELLESLKAELGVSGSSFFYSVCDVSRETEVEKVARAIKEENFLPDAVILNAAILREDVDGSYNHSLASEVFNVNLNGALIWVEKFLGMFLERGRGHFIAVSSTSAFRPIWGSISYPASKAAISMAFRGFRLQYRKKGVVFSSVYFGPVATDISPGYLSASGWRKFFFVMTPKKAAQCLMKVVKTKKSVYYFPFFITLIIRLTLFLPDGLFVKFSRYLKRP